MFKSLIFQVLVLIRLPVKSDLFISSPVMLSSKDNESGEKVSTHLIILAEPDLIIPMRIKTVRDVVLRGSSRGVESRIYELIELVEV